MHHSIGMPLHALDSEALAVIGVKPGIPSSAASGTRDWHGSASLVSHVADCVVCSPRRRQVTETHYSG